MAKSKLNKQQILAETGLTEAEFYKYFPDEKSYRAYKKAMGKVPMAKTGWNFGSMSSTSATALPTAGTYTTPTQNTQFNPTTASTGMTPQQIKQWEFENQNKLRAQYQAGRTPAQAASDAADYKKIQNVKIMSEAPLQSTASPLDMVGAGLFHGAFSSIPKLATSIGQEYIAHKVTPHKQGGSVFPQIQTEAQFFSPAYANIPSPYNGSSLKMGGFPQIHAFPTQATMKEFSSYGRPNWPQYIADEGGVPIWPKSPYYNANFRVPYPMNPDGTQDVYRTPIANTPDTRMPYMYEEDPEITLPPMSFRSQDNAPWDNQFGNFTISRKMGGMMTCGCGGKMGKGGSCMKCGGYKMYNGGTKSQEQAEMNEGPEVFNQKQSKFLQKLKANSTAAMISKMANTHMMPNRTIMSNDEMKNGGIPEMFPYATRYFADGGWIQKATASIKRRGTEGVCTGAKFGSSTCPPGSRRYNLAETFRKMAKNRQEGGEGDIDMSNLSSEDWEAYVLSPQGQELAQKYGFQDSESFLQAYPTAQDYMGEEESFTKPGLEEAQYGNTGRSDINPQAMSTYGMYAQNAEQSKEKYNVGKNWGNFMGDLMNISSYYNQPAQMVSQPQTTQPIQQPQTTGKLNFANTMNMRNTKAQTGKAYDPSIHDPRNSIPNSALFPDTAPTYGTTITPPPFTPYEDVTGQVPVGVDPGLLNPEGGLQYQWDTASPSSPMASMQNAPVPAKPYVPKVVKEKKKNISASTGYKTLDAMIADYKATPDNDPAKVKKAQKIRDVISTEFEGDVLYADAARITVGKLKFDDPKLNTYNELNAYLSNTAEKKKKDYIDKLRKQYDAIVKQGEGLMPSEKAAMNWQGQITSIAKQINEARDADSEIFIQESVAAAPAPIPSIINPAVGTSTLGSNTGYSWATPAPQEAKKPAGWFLNRKTGRIEAANYPGWFYNDKTGKIEEEKKAYMPAVTSSPGTTGFAYGGDYLPTYPHGGGHESSGGPDTTGLGAIAKQLAAFQDSIAKAGNKPKVDPTAGYDKGYVDAELAARKAGEKTFVYNGKTYDSKTGRAVASAPVDKTKEGAKKAVAQVQQNNQQAPAATTPAATTPSGDYMTKKEFEEWKKQQPSSSTQTDQQTAYNYGPQGGFPAYGMFGYNPYGSLYKQKVRINGDVYNTGAPGMYGVRGHGDTPYASMSPEQLKQLENMRYKVEYEADPKNGFLGRALGLPPRRMKQKWTFTPVWNPQTGQVENVPSDLSSSPVINDPNNPGYQISVGPGYRQELPALPAVGPVSTAPMTGPATVTPNLPVAGKPSFDQFMATNVTPYTPGPAPEEQFPGNNPSGMYADSYPAPIPQPKRRGIFGRIFQEGGIYDLNENEIAEILRNGGTVEYI